MLIFSVFTLFIYLYAVVSKKELSKNIWYLALFTFILFISYSLGSRNFGVAPYDDYGNVYYKQIKYLSENGFVGFDKNIEAITHERVFYWILWFVGNIFNSRFWLFGISLITLSLLGIGLLKWFSPQLVIIILGLSSIGLCTQLIRQYLAWSLVLFIFNLISNKSKLYYILYVLPFFIHSSIIIFILLGWLRKIKWKYLILGAALLFLLFNLILSFVLNVDIYFVEFIASDSLEADILDYSYLFLNRMILLTIVSFLFNFERKYIFLSMFLFLILLPLPLMSVRFNLFLASHALGLTYVIIIGDNNKLHTRILNLACVTGVIMRILFFMNNDGFELWKNYSMIF